MNLKEKVASSLAIKLHVSFIRHSSSSPSPLCPSSFSLPLAPILCPLHLLLFSFILHLPDHTFLLKRFSKPCFLVLLCHFYSSDFATVRRLPARPACLLLTSYPSCSSCPSCPAPTCCSYVTTSANQKEDPCKVWVVSLTSRVWCIGKKYISFFFSLVCETKLRDLYCFWNIMLML